MVAQTYLLKTVGLGVKRMSEPTEMRQANDGIMYSREQFGQHYGLGGYERQWNAAAPTAGSSRVSRLTQQFEQGGSSAARLSDGRNLRAGRSSTDLAPPAARPGDVLQLTDTTADEPPSDVPQQGNSAADDPSSDVIQLTELRHVPGIGGRQACQKQRELRQLLLDQDAYDHDLTNDSWPWQSIIRAQPLQVQQLLVGPGIQKFSFRLLRGVLDTNYARTDAGYRHVFEIRRVDGSCYHLHYHKNGKCDKPSLIPSTHNPVTGSGASQPAVAPYQLHNIDYTHDAPLVRHARELLMETPVIGRNEASMACSLIVQECTSLGGINVIGALDIAVDITDGQTFAWRRWMHNQIYAHEMIGPGLVKLFVVRWRHDTRIQIACCRTDNTYTLKSVSDKKMPETLVDWTNAPIFRSPWVVPRDWMEMRR